MLNLNNTQNCSPQESPAHQIARMAADEAHYPLVSTSLLDMAQSATNKIVEKLQGDTSMLDNPLTLANTFRDSTMALIEAERPHRAHLEQLAIRIVKEHFGIVNSPSIQLEGTIIPLEMMETAGTVPNRHPIRDDIRSGVLKRRLTNAIIQGGSSTLDQLTHLYAEEVSELSPTLFRQQMHHHNIANAQFFAFNDVLLDIPPGEELPPAGGLARVSHLEDVVRVEAKAVTFTLLVHELSKGVLEALALIGREQDDIKRMKIEHIADDPRLEGIDIFLGREIWGRLIRTSDKRGVEFYQDLQRLFALEPDAFIGEVQRRCAQGPSSAAIQRR